MMSGLRRKESLCKGYCESPTSVQGLLLKRTCKGSNSYRVSPLSGKQGVCKQARQNSINKPYRYPMPCNNRVPSPSPAQYLHFLLLQRPRVVDSFWRSWSGRESNRVRSFIHQRAHAHISHTNQQQNLHARLKEEDLVRVEGVRCVCWWIFLDWRLWCVA